MSYVLDSLYDIPSKILHLGKGEDLRGQLTTLAEHFRGKGSPVMMGGETDVSSKGIMGVCQGEREAYLLVVVSKGVNGSKFERTQGKSEMRGEGKRW